jgi:phospholipid-binding lipoprotein MlaA
VGLEATQSKTVDVNQSKESKEGESHIQDQENELVIDDPLEQLNRSIFVFNQRLDSYGIKPLSFIYQKAFPEVIQDRIRDAALNWTEPISMINSVFQLDREKFALHFTRFLVNTIFGLLGFVDVAKMMGHEGKIETFAHTMQNAGVGAGSFVMLPVIGPSTTRDALGLLVTAFMNPLIWICYRHYPLGAYVPPAVYTLDELFQSLTGKETLKNFHDPYVTLRGWYYDQQDSGIQGKSWQDGWSDDDEDDDKEDNNEDEDWDESDEDEDSDDDWADGNDDDHEEDDEDWDDDEDEDSDDDWADGNDDDHEEDDEDWDDDEG